MFFKKRKLLLRYDCGKKAFILFCRGVYSRLIGKCPCLSSKQSALIGERAGALSDIEIHEMEVDRLALVDPNGMKGWSEPQIEALRSEQIKGLTAEQLRVLIRSESITSSQVGRFFGELCAPHHLGKVGIMIQALSSDRFLEKKCAAIADAVENVLDGRCARNVLVAVARSADENTFRKLLAHLHFQKILELTAEEIQNPDEEERQRLIQRVEERHFKNSRQLREIEQDRLALELLLSTEKAPKEIRMKKCPWRHLPRSKVMRFEERLSQRLGMDKELIKEFDLELAHMQHHLHSENLRVSRMIEQWSETYLSELEVRCQLLHHLFKGSKENFQIFEQEVEALSVALQQLEWDLQFFDEEIEVLLENIRYETGIGRFSLEFYRRVLDLEYDPEAFHFAHSDEYQALLVEYPSFKEGMQRIEELYALKKYVGWVQHLVSQFLLQRAKD